MLWRKFRRKSKHPILNADIEYAFTCGGKEYYKFKEIGRMPARRYSEFLLKFQELEMSVTREWLQNVFVADMMKEISGATGNINLANISRLVWELKMRMELAAPEDSVYNAASIYYFDLSENLATYDFQYNREKIATWKAAEEPADFFSRKPISELIGWQEFSKETISTYLENLKIARALIERQFLRTSKGN